MAQTDKMTVMIRGESGTGKEQLALYVHAQSARSSQPFPALNCAVLTDMVLESRLFGFQKGAFTGAEKTTPGLFEQATGSTVFLDEIGDISPNLQILLLRVLQEGEIQPVGGQPRKVNERVFAAIHAELEKHCWNGRFRGDLYYRLAVAELELPALREWPAREREQLLNHLLNHLIVTKQRDLAKAHPLLLSAATRRQLLNYSFPGNIRELANLLDTLYVFDSESKVEPAHLLRRVQQPVGGSFFLRLVDVDREYLLRVMALKNNVKRQAASALDMDERTLAEKLLAYHPTTGESLLWLAGHRSHPWHELPCIPHKLRLGQPIKAL